MILGSDLLTKTLDRVKRVYTEENRKEMIVKSIKFVGDWTIVLGSKNEIGIGYNFISYGNKDIKNYDLLKNYEGKTMMKMAEDLCVKEDIVYKSLGIAALNALSEPLVNIGRYYNKRFTLGEKVGHYVIDTDKVTVVDINTYSNRFKERCRSLKVIPINDKGAYEYIEESDVVILPGKSIGNSSLYEYLEHAKKARVIGLYDVTAQMLPEELFNLGINHINVTKIKNSLEFIKDLEEGMEFEEALIKNSICFYIYNENKNNLQSNLFCVR